MKNKIIKKIRTFVLGERAKGEYAYTQPTFRTVSGEQIKEYDWYKELKISSLYVKN